MLITELQPILDALNQKEYAQRNGLPTVDEPALTQEEKRVIQTYRPGHWLVVYGSLAPGRPNHPVVEPIKGTWQKGTVRGQLEDKGWGADLGYYGFTPARNQEPVEIAVYVLQSNELVVHWSRLDAFEGAGYQRMLVSFILENGVIGVGNIYALHDNSPS